MTDAPTMKCPKCESTNLQEYAQTRPVGDISPNPMRCLDCLEIFHPDWLTLLAAEQSRADKAVEEMHLMEQLRREDHGKEAADIITNLRGEFQDANKRAETLERALAHRKIQVRDLRDSVDAANERANSDGQKSNTFTCMACRKSVNGTEITIRGGHVFCPTCLNNYVNKRAK